MARYAVGDIHGGSKTLRALLDSLLLKQSDQLYLLGDYVDRGNDSKGVLDTIMQLMAAGYDVRPLRGNHDDMMLRAFTGVHDDCSWHWMRGWGQHTLASFGVISVNHVPSQYLTFLDSLPHIHILDDLVLVHAALEMDYNDPLGQTNTFTMLWGDVLDSDPKKIGGRTLVTGHRIQPMPFIEISLMTKRIFLDNGAFTNQQPDLGNLLALNLDTKELTIQPWLDGEAVA